MIGARRAGRILVVASALLAPLPSHATARATVPAPASVRAADSLVTTPASAARVAAFRTWAHRASLVELMYVLRRSPRELGDLEAPAVEAARARVTADHPAVREALEARAAADRRGDRTVAAAPVRSVFRVALVLPDSGDYAEDASALERGVRASFATRSPPLDPPVECVTFHTGADGPGPVAAALDSAAAVAGMACGGFAPAAVPVLASGSRWLGLPVLLPMNGGAQALELSPRAWTLDPPGEERGRALANAVRVGEDDRIAVLVSTARPAGFGAGFVNACRARGAHIVYQQTYAAGNQSWVSEVRFMIGQRANVLFWDGAPAEGGELLRELTHERVSMRVCGGEGLAPELHHRETRVLLEGVVFVRDDWSLTPAEESALERALPDDLVAGGEAGGGGAPAEAAVRGFLAGRIVAAAIASGALTSDELAAALRGSSTVASGVRALGLRSEGAELPVYSVAAGQAQRIQ